MDFGTRIAVLIPCLDEEATIGFVVEGFASALPGCTVYVYDNGSTDGSVERAREAGATVRTELSLGKGEVVRRMFADIDADNYVIADGDGTYDPTQAPALVRRLVEDNLDMVVGARTDLDQSTGRFGHGVGNRLFNRLYRALFGSGFTDIFSGYRVFSRRFVKSFPAVATGFEIETEMSVHASQLRLPVADIPVDYGTRRDNSASKLHTIRDGTRILRAIVVLLKDNRPLLLFGWMATLCTLASLTLGIPIVVAFARTGLVERLPTAVLASGLAVAGVLLLALGLILDTVARARTEAKRLSYLKIP